MLTNSKVKHQTVQIVIAWSIVPLYWQQELVGAGLLFDSIRLAATPLSLQCPAGYNIES